MLYHTLITIARQIRKSKGWFLVNLFGLSTGLFCSIILYLWIKNERAVDNFHYDGDNLYKVYKTHEFPKQVRTFEWTPGPLAEELKNSLPEVTSSINIYQAGDGIVYENNSSLPQELRVKEYYVGDNFFDFFSYNLLQGDKSNVLTNDNSAVISEELSIKLFKTTENVIGKSITLDQRDAQSTFIVSGVFEDVTSQSSLEFDILFPFDHLVKIRPSFKGWEDNSPLTFIRLNETASISAVDQKMTEIINSKVDLDNSKVTMSAHKFSSLYLNGNFENGEQAGGRILYIQLFFIVSIFILLIACINFTNLTTALATKRTKEVGVKKAMGINRGSLIWQFLLESLIVTTMSFVISLIMAYALLPLLNDILGKDLTLTLDFTLIAYAVLIIVITSVVAGLYPSFYLSKFNPVSLLRGKLQMVNKSWVRQGLVIIQFTISVILIVSILILNNQLSFIFDKELGYTKENVIEFKIEGNLTKNTDTFLKELRNIPGVINASTAEHNLMGEHGDTYNVVWEGKDPSSDITFAYLNGGFSFLETMDINIVEGRSYSDDFGAEYDNVIVNETAIEIMGLENPIGKTISIWQENRRIVGVMEDFHLDSFYEKVPPTFINLSRRSSEVFVRVNDKAPEETLARVEAFFKEYNNGLPFDYTYMESSYEDLYLLENKVSHISQYATIIAILISSLGLYSLAAFSVNRKRKEIAIRKTLGSSTGNIFLRLIMQLSTSVFVALIIALPASFFIARNWLNTFSYRIDLSVWFFAVAGLAALVIAWGTISYTILKGSQINPIDILRNE